MKKEQTMDMTRGPVLQQMAVFAFPVLLGMLCQRIYNFADTYIVGRFLGDQALAAVSISGSAMYMMFSIMMGVTTGVSMVIAQFYGAGEKKEIQDTFVAGAWVSVLIAILLTVLGTLTAGPLLGLLQTSKELMPQAYSYLVVIYLGCGATMLYNFASAVLRALGNSVVPLVFLILSSILNVILDVAFVSWIPMGVAGAAFATVLSQLISGVLCLGYALRILPLLRVPKRQWKPKPYLVKEVLRYGLPTGLQMSIISVSDMTLQAVVNTYGTAMIVAYGVCMKVEGLGFQLADAVGTAMGTFAGQNAGAGNYQRIRKGVNSAYLLNLLCYGIFCPAVFFLAEPIMRAFTGTPEAIAYGVEYMRIFTVFFLAGGILVVYHNILRATGDVAVTVLMGLSEVVSRIGCAFLLPAWFGYRGLWFVSPITWICAALVGAVRYYSGAWEKKRRKSGRMQ
ncbi:MAG TPA: MATE family efflux transporter [Candidatus Blautia gallistercoris]|uniref:Probable multidrug resistance protein NorM n=1 Tax=Candidatus Blautia gallistercoris TaxID=2838490 RepID=A0A9D1WIC4_9FIRM|nr:MATE family efflux transporter [Candidatus Blautia gallistercoris]